MNNNINVFIYVHISQNRLFSPHSLSLCPSLSLPPSLSLHLSVSPSLPLPCTHLQLCNTIPPNEGRISPINFANREQWRFQPPWSSHTDRKRAISAHELQLIRLPSFALKRKISLEENNALFFFFIHLHSEKLKLRKKTALLLLGYVRMCYHCCTGDRVV